VNDDLPFDIESDIKEIEYLLNHDPIKDMDSILKDSIDESNLANSNVNLFDTIPKMFTDEHALDYSSPPIYDDYDDDLDEFESDNDDAYNDPFDSKEEKIKESKLLINELYLPRSSDFLPSPEYDSFLFEDFPIVPFILGRPFLRTARALIDVHKEEMILRDEVKDDNFDPEGDMVLIEKLINLDSTKDLPPPHNINPLSGSTTFSSPNHLLEEFADELALIIFPPRNDDLSFDIESDLKEIEYFLNRDPIKEMDSILEDSVDVDNLSNLNDNLIDTMPEMFTDEHALDYSSLRLYDEYDDDLFEVKFDTEFAYDDLFDSKGEKIKESKLLIDKLDLHRSSDFFPSPEYDSFLFEDFFEVDALPSTNNEDKVFNLGILIQENLSKNNVQATTDKNVKKIAISHASFILKDFDPPLSLYELPFHKEVPRSKTLLSFSFKNEEKLFKPKNLASKGVHSSFLLKLYHRGHKVFKIIKILKSPMEIFPCFCGEDIHILDVPYLHFYPP
nr:hypothetical protein [Tanacetum cinerariifolium]